MTKIQIVQSDCWLYVFSDGVALGGLDDLTYCDISELIEHACDIESRKILPQGYVPEVAIEQYTDDCLSSEMYEEFDKLRASQDTLSYGQFLYFYEDGPKPLRSYSLKLSNTLDK